MLKFDPDRWIAERLQPEDTGLAGLATLAGVTSENENAVSEVEPAKAARVANPRDEQPPRIGVSADAPATWKGHVAGLNRSAPLAGFSPARWREYCSDARWLVERHGAELAEAGFSLADLFELLPGRPDGGGLIEMLRGARELSIDGPVVSFARGVVTFRFEGAGGGDSTGWIGRAPSQP